MKLNSYPAVMLNNTIVSASATASYRRRYPVVTADFLFFLFSFFLSFFLSSSSYSTFQPKFAFSSTL